MAEGIDVIDDDLDLEPVKEDSSGSSNGAFIDNSYSSDADDKEVLDVLLKTKGIDDKSRIKFDAGNGYVQEADWKDLNPIEKLNVLKSTEETPESALSSAEIQLLNTIRNSGLSPKEFVDYVGDTSVQNFVNSNQPEPQFEVDQYSDDELYLMDLMSRTDNITEDEALEALQKAKSNELLFSKQISSIRNEYKQAEQENAMQEQIEQEQQMLDQYDDFSSQIVDEINNLQGIEGFDIDMDTEDKQSLYDFILGQDAAGNTFMNKALADPKLLVKTAWFALNGEQMINDITEYFANEIANVRQYSYNKGLQDAHNQINNNNFIYRDKSRSNNSSYDDLDNF